MKAEYVDHLGDDLRVVNAARVSFDKESEWRIDGYVNVTGVDSRSITSYPIEKLQEKDAKLIRYLATHGHWSPFSHPQITLRYTVPIFVARQEFKHIVGFTRNEVSRRYVDDEPEFFVPDNWRKRPVGSVKQGSEGPLPEGAWLRTEDSYLEAVDTCLFAYKEMLKNGVAPEQARMVLPQSMYTSYYITGSLAAFARFYRQRTDSHAQAEIQELAKQVGAIIEPLYPVSWEALTK